MKKLTLSLTYLISMACLSAAPSFTVDATKTSGKVSPRFFGLMTEEINHCYDGGLYAELIRNRNFLDDKKPLHWAAVNDSDSSAAITLDSAKPYNAAMTTSLRLKVKKATREHPAGVANEGYWGIPVQPNTTYKATVLARAEENFSGSLTVSIVSEDGKTVYAKEQITGVSSKWNKFQVSLKTGQAAPTTKANFRITIEQPGTVWFGMVSLFPPTWNDRPNGLRKDLMQMLVDLKPKFLRFPGGNYLEGDTLAERFEWKKTLGPIEERHGHQCPWGYRSTDGMGLMEFLLWAEDLKAEPIIGVYAGYSLKGLQVKPGIAMVPYVLEALEEIEYIIGPTNTYWGARRGKDGHPEPFKMTYVEVGNEDWFDKTYSYDARYTQFHDAIKARYPQLKLISTIAADQPKVPGVTSRKPDMLDEHYYKSTDEFVKMSLDYAKDYPRTGPEIFVGEWAAHEDAKIRPWEPGAKQQPPTPTMLAALGDAVFMASMERNSDIILMNAYAPLLVNVNPGARQWRPDLIGYDAITSYGSPSYYAIQMFSQNLGDEILPVTSADTAVQGCATRDSKTGDYFIKLVNPQAKAEPLKLEIKGVSLESGATVTTLTGKLEEINALENPRKVYPVTTTITDAQPVLNQTLPPNSIVVIKLKARR